MNRTVLRTADMSEEMLAAEKRHLRTLAALAKDGLPQYRNHWDDWGVGEIVSVEGLKSKAARVLPVGELVLVEPHDADAEHVSVYSRIGGDNWIVPVGCVHIALPPG